MIYRISSFIFLVLNFVIAAYWAFESNIGLELISLFACYCSWQVLRDELKG